MWRTEKVFSLARHFSSVRPLPPVGVAGVGVVGAGAGEEDEGGGGLVVGVSVSSFAKLAFFCVHKQSVNQKPATGPSQNKQ